MCSEGLRERYVNPYTDFAFKLLFGTDLNKEILIGFLNALFDGKQVIEDVIYLNTKVPLRVLSASRAPLP